MRRATWKLAVLAAAAGTMLQFGGCGFLDGGIFDAVVFGAGRSIGATLGGVVDLSFLTDLIPAGG